MILAVGYIDVSMAVRVVFTVGCLLLLPVAWKGIANLWADRTRAFDEPPGVTLGAAAVAAIVAVAVAFLTRPQFAVPPARRDQPGALAEWRRNWRRRREANSAP